MKVCFITGTYPDIRCGVGSHTYYLAQKLSLKNHAVSVITTKSTSLNAQLLTQRNPRIFPIVNNWDRDFKIIRKIITEIDPDVIHIQHPTAIRGKFLATFLPYRLAHNFPKMKIVLTLHELTEAPLLGMIRNLIIILMTPIVVFPNPNDICFARRIMPWRKKRFFEIPIGPTLPLPPLQEIKKNPLPHTHTIAVHGFLEPNRHIECLLTIISDLQKTFPNIKLRILTSVDPHNPYHASIIHRIQKLSLENVVHYNTSISSQEIAHELQQARVSVLLFHHGATLRRSTLLESLSAGVPTITTLSHRTPHKLREAQCLTFVTLHDTQALYQSLYKLLSNSTAANLQREHAFQFIENGYTWDIIAEKTAALYNTNLAEM